MRLNVGRFHSRALVFLVAGAVLLAMAALGLSSRRETAGKTRVLAAAPPDSWLVLSVDVAAAWPLLQPLVGSDAGLAGASRIAGLGTVSAVCGFEPLEHVRELLVALPEHDADRGDFGLAFDGDFTAESLEACARKAIASGGGTPASSAHGDYARITNTKDPQAASLATRPGGPYLVGRGAWLDAMIDAVDGKTAGATVHDAMRRTLRDAASGEPGLVVTALLPRTLRDRLAGERPEVPAGLDAGVPDASAERIGKTPPGILGVREAGLAIVAHGPSTSPTALTDIDLEVRCDTAVACADVKTFLEHERFALSGDLRARLMGLGPLIDALAIRVGVGVGIGGGIKAPGAGPPGASGTAAPGASGTAAPGTSGINGHIAGSGARETPTAPAADGDALSVTTDAPTGDLAKLLARLAASPRP
jgi:hypothetical protein